MSRSTVREDIVSFLNTFSLNGPFQQYQIAIHINRPASSVRREVQRLRKDGLIVTQDHLGTSGNYGHGSAPRVTLAPKVSDVMTAATYDIAPLSPEMIGAIS